LQQVALQIIDFALVVRKYFHPNDLNGFEGCDHARLVPSGSHNAIVRRNGEITGNGRPIYFCEASS
jgi:hypothetical protein